MTRKYNTQHPTRGKSNYPNKTRGERYTDLRTLRNRQMCKCGDNKILCGHKIQKEVENGS